MAAFAALLAVAGLGASHATSPLNARRVKQHPPVVITPPTISGDTTDGQTLSTTTGAWTGAPTTFGYQWRDCNESGTGCVDVVGATHASYVLSDGDASHTLSVIVTATNGSGSSETATPTTALVSPALPDVGIAAGADLQNWGATDLDRQLDDYLNLHSHWIRHDFAWDAIEPQQGSFLWSGFDQLVSAARTRDLNVIATVSYTPAWANGAHADHDYQPLSAQQFGEFAGEVASRYGPQGVHVYEIWNEPNIGFWEPVPSPSSYTSVLCAAYHDIHAADPAATVLTGGTSPAGDGPTTFSPQTWLSDLYADGAAPCFDAVAHHPYIDSSTTPGDLGNAWELMYDAYPPSNLRGIMAVNGDSAKRIWATEVGCNRVALGDTECSDRISEAFQLWRGYAWAGALTWFIYWDPNVYGLVDGAWARRPEWYAYQAAASGYP
jgi:hypothetical protein